MSDAVPKRSAGKPLLVGCGVATVVLLLCGGAVAFFGARGRNLFQAGMKQAAEDEELARRWRPPGGPGAEGAFAPESVAGYELTSADENAAFPALGIDREGSHAVYKKGDGTVEVSVYRADEVETSAVFDEVIRRISDGRFKAQSHVRLSRSLRFSVSDPADLNGVLWHAQGWLAFVRSATVSDLAPFVRDYLTRVSAGAASKGDRADGAQGPGAAGRGQAAG